MTRNNELRAMLQRMIDYIDHYDRTASLPDCNDCKAPHCSYMPKPGEFVRINCPLFGVGTPAEDVDDGR